MASAPKNPNIEDILRLSPMQELMLLHSLADPNSHVLTTQFSYELHGNLVLEEFRGAWESLIERHASLRTGFVWEGLPHPVQAVRRRAKLRFTAVDLRGLPEAEREARLATIRAEDRAKTFDLVRPPLLRVTCVRLNHDSVLLIGSAHHR